MQFPCISKPQGGVGQCRPLGCGRFLCGRVERCVQWGWLVFGFFVFHPEAAARAARG
jgi:hypothetical protein